MRRVVPEKPQHLVLDGPGSFGPLHETLTLGCLRVLSIETLNGGPTATLVDERSKAYLVRVGDWIGEHAGRISEISDKRITVVQIVAGPTGDLVESNRYLFLRAAGER
jgi:Tfp pilus assembly protein PilP